MGRHGEREGAFDKGSGKFKFGHDLMVNVKKGTKTWSKNPTKQCCNLLAKDKKGNATNPTVVNVQLEKKSNNAKEVRKVGSKRKKESEDECV